ncbi:hypothetical protein [Phenylobacterium sp.]|uniref:hypothetical protein n=1 Tax=Phenylobacterium sp. TaxID=1871053 RepID=UPI0037838914
MNRRLATFAALRDSTAAAQKLRPPADVQAALETVRAYAAAELDRRQKARTRAAGEHAGCP